MSKKLVSVYQLDESGVFTGAVRYIKQGEGVPLGWTRSKPPADRAQLSGRGWVLIN